MPKPASPRLPESEPAADVALVSRDPQLHAAVARVAAAAGATVAIVDVSALHVSALHRGRLAAGSVLIGDDCLAEIAAANRLLGRARVRVATVRPAMADDPDVLRAALALRADAVIALPADERALVAWLSRDRRDADLERGSAFGLVGASGGLGTSTLAALVAVVAAGSMRSVVLVDADCDAAGLDLLLGCEDVAGARWAELRAAGADLSPTAFGAALPSVGPLAVLTSSRALDAGRLSDSVLSAALALARRGSDLVAVDLPRSCPAAFARTAGSLDAIAVLISGDVAGIVAGRRLASALDDCGARAGVVVSRVSPWGRRHRALDAGEVADEIGAPLLGVLGRRPGVARSIDAGLGPPVGRPDRRLVRGLLGGLERLALGASDDRLAGAR